MDDNDTITIFWLIDGGQQRQRRLGQPEQFLSYSTIRQSSSKVQGSAIRKDCQSVNWIVSDTLTRKKSVFLARAAHVTSEHDARKYVEHLIATDKKVAKATHNVTAWRIKGQGEFNDIQNSDDDGESAAGGKLLTLLQMTDAWNVMVVVSRWFGGIKLGPERFRAINSVAKDALSRGGWNESGNQDTERFVKKSGAASGSSNSKKKRK
ncbi:eIF2 kinase Gcn2p negative regulator [Ascosphaera aggregata]|nr:eIF2 kinase Gcn2p negative regulator [Ascosphaera aggregata]